MSFPVSVRVLGQQAGGRKTMDRQASRGHARRVRGIRVEWFSEGDIPLLAGTLGVPERTWSDYEAGVTIPSPVILRFIELTGVNPRWLRTGKGDRYGDPRRDFDGW